MTLECVVGVVVVMACGALFDQAASGVAQQRRQIQRHFPEGEEVFKERGEAGDAAIARLGRTE